MAFDHERPPPETLTVATGPLQVTSTETNTTLPASAVTPAIVKLAALPPFCGVASKGPFERATAASARGAKNSASATMTLKRLAHWDDLGLWSLPAGCEQGMFAHPERGAPSWPRVPTQFVRTTTRGDGKQRAPDRPSTRSSTGTREPDRSRHECIGAAW